MPGPGSAHGTDGLLHVMQQIQGQITVQGREIQEIKISQASILADLTSKVNAMADLMRDNGRGSLPSRLAVVEQQVVDLKHDTEKVQAVRWQTWIAMISSILSVIGSAVVYAFTNKG